MVPKYIHECKDKNLFVLFFAFYSTATATVYSYTTAYIANQINPEFLNARGFKALPFAELLFIALILAPLIESLLFQAVLIELLLKFFKKRYGVIVCVAGGIFALAHWYNLVYVLVAFFIGIWFGIYYLIVKEKTNSKITAYWNLVLLHALCNLTSFVISNFN